MNKVIIMGRLTRDPEIRYAQADSAIPVARYTLAVNRYRRNGGEQQADFIPCVVFRKGAEFAEKYLHQGMKLLVSGHIQTGNYVNKEGQKVYTTEVVVTEQEFAEKKAFSPGSGRLDTAEVGSLSIPEDIDEAELPFQ